MDVRLVILAAELDSGSVEVVAHQRLDSLDLITLRSTEVNEDIIARVCDVGTHSLVQFSGGRNSSTLVVPDTDRNRMEFQNGDTRTWVSFDQTRAIIRTGSSLCSRIMERIVPKHTTDNYPVAYDLIPA